MRENAEDAGPGARDTAEQLALSDDAAVKKQLMPENGRSNGAAGGGIDSPGCGGDDGDDEESARAASGLGELLEGQFYTLDDALDQCGKAGWFQLGMLGFTGLSW